MPHDSGDRPFATEEEAKALASAVRIRILRLCLDTALTNKQIAQRMEMNPATVLHHVRKLVATDFLAAEPARTGARGAKEIPYRATGRSWRIRLEPQFHSTLSKVMVAAFIAEFPEEPEPSTFMRRLGVRLTDAEYTELCDRLSNVLAEYVNRTSSSEPDAKPYSIFTTVHSDNGRERSLPGDTE
ncbi:helix-turn-helix protein [Stackebrandtia endophytica]|uniref:Helix-turn-helix protein n=1 Tax=Stackebrandtia endophytica TaxID=1496996 RepID=A0A543AWN0_9ACTN|nr:winged helix-turn-helix domain-containing protein [Stackebrandtia endophytica]TQL76960.1 helix-turn-helix protein [Stackebrandtia endophytica]